MIKINLLRDSGFQGAGAADTGQVKESVAPAEVAEYLGKAIALFLPVLLLYVYRGYNHIVLSNRLDNIKKEQSITEEKLKALDPAVKEMERFQVEKRKLDSQLDVIKRLSKERLKNVKSMDALQGIIPQRAWLTELKLIDNKVEITGFATDDLVISEFMSALEASIYFANVTLIASEESKTATGDVKRFSLKCVLENL